MHTHKWTYITDLPKNWREYSDVELQSLTEKWQERAKALKNSKNYERFHEQLRRKWAIETGIIERLYTLSESATRTLIERGLDAAFIGHDETDRPPRLVVAMIQDQYNAIEGLYQFVSGERPLGISYIKELHRVLTTNQEDCEAIDTFGRPTKKKLTKGAWKTWTNNVDFGDGNVFEYCPPEHVDSEMGQLLQWHEEHWQQDVSPEVEAAWLHHRFTLIHPFEDGNGRVARCLATLVLLKKSYFPLVVTRNDRGTYLEALRAADNDDFGRLTVFFASLQKKSLLEALSLSEDASTGSDVEQVFDAALIRTREIARKRNEKTRAFVSTLCEWAAAHLSEVADKGKRKLKSASPSYDAAVKQSKDGEELYNRHQVYQCAKQLGYYANLHAVSSWVKLIITTIDRWEILVSFHGIGPAWTGVFGASAMTYRKIIEERFADDLPSGTLPKKEDLSRPRQIVDEVHPLSAEPFLFTERDSPEALKPRFTSWLSECVVVGLRLWEAGT